MFIPIHNYSHYSILKGLSKPDQIIKEAILNKYPAVGLTDINSLSGSVAFVNTIKSICSNCGKQEDDDVHTAKSCVFQKSSIRPILGVTLEVEDKKLTIIAKNFDGWKRLLRVIGDESRTNKPITIQRLSEIYDKSYSWIITTGKIGTFDDIDKIKLITDDFDDVYIDIDRNRVEYCRELAKISNLKPLACVESYYIKKNDKEDHNLLIALENKVGIKELNLIKNLDSLKFLSDNEYHFPQLDMLEVFTPEELSNTVGILDKIDNFDILSRSRLPKFPETDDESALLRQKCLDGWKTRLVDKGILDNQEKKEQYAARAKEELEIIDKANLNGYFLIVQDYVNWAKRNNILTGAGRGSAGGSLVSYLLGIINIDPIKYKLLFSRFYNEGRNTADKIALPDIDVDFPKFKRDMVIGYITNKYGKEKVGNIITFSRLKGRSAIDAVLRTHDVCSFAIIKQITNVIPQEAEIIDSLQEQDEDSIIHWCLKNNANLLKEWCFITDDGSLDGPLAPYFAQAIRIEGTIRGQGVHASGICIANDSLNETCPMVYDTKNEKFIVGLEGEDLEALSIMKADILGLTALSKLEYVNSLLKGDV